MLNVNKKELKKNNFILVYLTITLSEYIIIFFRLGINIQCSHHSPLSDLKTVVPDWFTNHLSLEP